MTRTADIGHDDIGDADGGQRRPGRPREPGYDQTILEAVLEILFSTGARVAEVCHLLDKDVDLRRGATPVANFVSTSTAFLTIARRSSGSPSSSNAVSGVKSAHRAASMAANWARDSASASSFGTVTLRSAGTLKRGV